MLEYEKYLTRFERLNLEEYQHIDTDSIISTKEKYLEKVPFFPFFLLVTLGLRLRRHFFKVILILFTNIFLLQFDAEIEATDDKTHHNNLENELNILQNGAIADIRRRRSEYEDYLTQQKNRKIKMAGGAAAGAALGSFAGPPGMIIGGLLGFLFGSNA